MARKATHVSRALALICLLLWLQYDTVDAQTGCTPETCGGRSNNGCWCDDACFSYNDCCFSDVRQVCYKPTVTSLSPSSGPTNGGTRLTLSGQNFGTSSNTVQVGSEGTCSVVSWANQKIICDTPDGTGTGHQFTITNEWGVQDTSTATFSYNAPAISGLNPSSGPSGPSSSTASITLTGTSFGSNLGTASVSVGSSACTISSRSHTQIVCKTPTGQGVGFSVTVTITGQTSNALTFSYSAPAISSINPTSASTDGTATLTIYGSSLGSTTPRSIGVGGVDCPVSYHTHSEMRCDLPAGQGVSKEVRVTVSNQLSNAVLFSYSAPTVTGILPANGPTAGSTSVVISGTSLGTSGSITIGGTAVQSVTSHSHNSITVVTPQGEGESREVVVSVSSQVSNNNIVFNYDPPSITGLTPPNLKTKGGETFTVTGNNFGSSGQVSVGNNDCVFISRTVNTQILCTMPAGSGTVNVIVTVLTLTSAAVSYSYGAPDISDVSPLTGGTAGGTTLVFTGINFGSSGVAKIGDRQCLPTGAGWDHERIECALPAGQGTNQLTKVISAGQETGTGEPKFNYIGPTLSTVSPPSGPTQGGFALTLGGSNFGVSPTVNIEGAGNCPVSSRTHTQVVCIVPVGGGRDLDVTIDVGGQPSVKSSSFSYNYPTITSVAPSVATTSGNVQITVRGDSFGSDGSVTINAISCPKVTWAHSIIVCTLPAGQGANLDVVVTVSGTNFATDNSQSNPPGKFSYNAPVINSVTPASAPTGGVTTILTIAGIDMGTANAASVTIGGTKTNDVVTGGTTCQLQASIHTQVTCTLPEGLGASQLVQVQVSGQYSNTITFSYSPPDITSISPTTGPANNGGITLTLFGTSFGKSAGAPTGVSVSVGGSDCPVLSGKHDHQRVECTLPAGVGSQLVSIVVGGQPSTSSVFFLYDAPVISTVITNAPRDTKGGIPVTLTGVNFGTSTSTASVQLASTPVIVNSVVDDKIVFTLPSGEGTINNVVVTVASQVSNTVNFAYAAPAITYIEPLTGPTAGGTSVTVNGLYFGTTGTVTVGGNECANPTRTDHVKIVCELPAGEGAGKVVEVTVKDQVSNTTTFDYNKPNITSISPLTGDTIGGVLFVVKGQNFGTSGSVLIGSYPCFPVVGGWTDSQIDCTLPSGQGEDLLVTVTVSNQANNNPNILFSYNRPTFTKVEPTNGPTAGVSPITVTGTNFGTSGAGIVNINNRTCVTSSYAHQTIVCALPEGQGQNLDATLQIPTQASRVTVDAGSSQTVQLATVGDKLWVDTAPTWVTYPEPLPSSLLYVRSYFTPSSDPNPPCATPGGAKFSVSVDFKAYVCIAAGAAPDTAGWNKLGTVISPTGASTACQFWEKGFGAGATAQVCATSNYASGVFVTERSLTALQKGVFSYDGPVLTSITPNSGSTDGTAVITLTGSSFDVPGSVTVGGTTCTHVSWSHTSVVCTVPEGEGRDQAVELTTSDLRTSNTLVFHYNAPTISVINPVMAFSGGNQDSRILTVSGSNFGLNAEVTVGGLPCPLAAAQTHTQIQCTLPDGEGSNKVVIVRVASTQTSNGVQFSYAPPNILGISPPTAPTVGGTTIQLNGTSFGTGASGSVTIGGKLCQIQANSHTHNGLRCSLPVGEGTSLPIVLTVASQLSTSSVTFSYDGPDISFITPTSGPTQGGFIMQVWGSNFGVGSGFVTIGGTTCGVIDFSHTSINCSVPSGEGINKEVRVTVGSLSSPTELFSYEAPVVSSINPKEALTSGGTALTVQGTNFGTSGFVTVGGVTCDPIATSACNPTCTIECNIPAGQGINRDVIVTTSGQSSPAGAVLFNYTAPFIQAIAPLNGPTAGKIEITITGTSFGISGDVSLDAQPCPIVAGAYSHTQIKCTLPVGQGVNKQFSVTVEGQTSNQKPFSYDKPSVTSITPTTGTTNGGYTLTLVGSNFGTVGTVKIGTADCIFGAQAVYADSRIECTVPAGYGINKQVVVTVSTQTSTPVIFSYAAPVLSKILPLEGPTAGGTIMTLIGSNFGCESGPHGDLTLKFNAISQPIISCNHTFMTFELPQGSGKSTVATLQVDTLLSNAVEGFSYIAPNITRVAGCGSSDTENSALRCPNSGSGITLTIYGSNLGWKEVASLSINNQPISNFEFTTNHSVITTPLPDGVGNDIPVTITVTGQSNTRNFISYAGPILTDGTLFEVGGTSGQTGFAYISNTDGGQVVNITGEFLGTDASKLTVQYGLPNGPALYNCTNVALDPTSGTFTCALSKGVGRGLVFSVLKELQPFGIQVSKQGSDFINYPIPVILNGTLKSENGPEQSELSGSSSTGQIILFRGLYFGEDASLISVRYGPRNDLLNNPGADTVRSCNDVQLPSPNQIQCLTSPGEGRDFVFQVTVRNALSDPGYDNYSYPEAPTVSQVSGCTSSGSQAISCPTAGGEVLDIYGTSFSPESLSVKIGGRDCGSVQYVDSGHIKCTLPEGAGFSQLVVVYVNTFFSQAVPYVSYAAPLLSSISGTENCTAVAGDSTLVENCPRAGGTPITIQGDNLGASDAIVLVGGSACTNVVHDTTTPHSKLTCQIPPGKTEKQSVFLIQGDGENAVNSLSLSYAPCPAGSKPSAFSNSTDCDLCAPGSFASSAGEVDCTQCEAGFYAAGYGNTICSPCSSGSFSLRDTVNGEVVGASACSNCTAGKFVTASGSAACEDCPAGRVSSSDGQPICIRCTEGKYANLQGLSKCLDCGSGAFSVAGATACTDCSPGYYSNGSIECQKCAIGRYQSARGQSSCIDCPLGTAVDVEGQASCPPCGSGFFANDTQLSSCFRCLAGSFSVKLASSSTGPSACTLCSAGEYIPVDGQATCLLCAKGQYQARPGSTTCVDCALGRANSLDGQSVCSNCTSGKFSATVGSGQCEECEVGRYSNTSEASFCYSCVQGFFQSARGQSSCSSCPVDSVARAEGQADCRACPDGQFAPAEGLSACSQCDLGRYKTAGSFIGTCGNCSAGTVVDTAGQASCRSCEPGTFINYTQATACVLCSVGQASSDYASTVCTDCTAGRFASVPGSLACQECPAGKYNNVTLGSGCEICPAGTKQASTAAAGCDDCAAGYFTSTDGQVACVTCAVGTFNNDTRMTTCFKCPAGKFQGSRGSSFCEECPVGKFAGSEGQGFCVQCPVGTYQANKGRSACIACSAGMFASSTESTSCTNCTAGRVSRTTGQFECVSCEAGTFASVQGLSTCTDCPSGSQQDSPASTFCNWCGAGKYAPGTGEVKCLDCPAGRFSEVDGTGPTTVCLSCGVGTYQPQAGQTECLNCTVGTIQKLNGSLTCDECPPGQYSDVLRSTACKVCGLGRYQSKAASSSCLDCPAGSSQSTQGQTACRACSSGYYSNQNGSSICSPCSVGTFSRRSGAELVGPTTCSECLAGFYINFEAQESCLSCPSGRYSNDTSQSTCVDCPPGQYQSLPGQTKCLACDAGEVTNTVGAKKCEACPAGAFAGTTGLSFCSTCIPGRYQPLAGQSKCEVCDAGLHNPSSAQDSCISCPIGRFSNATEATTCHVCPAGSYQGSVAQTECVLCAAGTYSSAPAQGNCIKCGVGEYGPVQGATTCVSCPAGQFQEKTEGTSCQNCTLGRFAGGSASVSCSDCPAGFYTNIQGASSCHACASGRYQPLSAQTECLACKAGTYAPGTAEVQCLACPAGEYTTGIDSSSAASCTPCIAGKFASDAGSSECKDCSTGKFAFNNGSASCTSCPAGSFAENQGQSLCVSCAAGKYQPSTGQSACLQCSPGRSMNVTGQQSCTDCVSGTYTTQPGAAFCLECSAGTYSVRLGNQGASVCIDCGRGTFSPAAAQTACTACAPGFYTNSTASTICTKCSPGKYAANSGQPVCFDCPQGYAASADGSISCDICPIGSFSGNAGSANCTECPIGTKAENPGTSECEYCPTGKYGLAKGQGTCRNCPPGRFGNSTGLQECLLCPEGRFSNDTGLRECYPCPLGEYQNFPGQAACLACGLGTRAPVVGLAVCELCPEGYFQNSLGQSSCTACAAGFFQNVAGESGCRPCPLGSYTNLTGRAQCTLCPKGTFETRLNSTRCQDCPVGQYIGVEGSLFCRNCQPGRYSDTEGLEECTNCETGRFQAGNNATSCNPCAEGSFTDNQGSSFCKDCFSGSFANTTGLAACIPCLQGKYQGDAGKSFCSQCPERTYAGTRGQTICDQCVTGKYNNVTGLSVCIDCWRGTYTNDVGQLQCTPCSKGTFGQFEGLTSCDVCEPGTSNPLTGQSACAPCSVGKYQNSANTTACIDCEQGYFSDKEGVEVCQPCAPGSNAPSTGTVTCPKCLAGTFQSLPAKSFCDQCPVGKSGTFSGATSCVNCLPGSFANETQLSLCYSCDPGRFTGVSGSQNCSLCAKGSYSPKPGGQICDFCPSGTFVDVDGATACLNCPEGKAGLALTEVQGRTLCDLCELGTFADGQGFSTCLKCAEAQYADTPGTITCKKCPLGTFGIEIGRSSCDNCTTGTYGPNEGITQCLACQRGTFNNRNGSSSCTACANGTSVGIRGAEKCDACVPGRFSDREGLEACALCPVGTFSNTTGLTVCIPCAKGSHSPVRGETVCTKCLVGRFASIEGLQDCELCPSGRVVAVNGSSSCGQCTPGLYQSNRGQSVCDSCTAGFYSDDVGLTNCLSCRPGFFQNDSAKSFCDDCPAGKYQDLSGRSFCRLCLEGEFSTNGTSECASCPKNTIAPGNGSTECSSCGRNAVSNIARTVCLCDIGYYNDESSVSYVQCQPCPTGANCDDPGSTFSTLQAANGYWRIDSNTLTFYRCLREEHCPGGDPATCQRHRVGPICALCEEGYHTFFGGECVQCPATGGSWTYLVFIGLALGLLYLAMMWIVLKGGDALLNQEEEIARKKAMYGAAYDSRALTEQAETVKISDKFLVKRPAQFMFKMKILLTFLQISTNLGVALEIPWPQAFKEFISFFSIANIDFIQASSAGCVVDTTYYKKFLYMTITPILIVFVLMAGYLIPRYWYIDQQYRKRKENAIRDNDFDPELEDTRRLSQRKRARRNAWKMLIFTLFLIYPVVSSTILRIFVCKDIEGTWYLLADFTKQCFNEEWDRYATVAGFMIVVYPVGIPVFFLAMLWRYKRQGRLREAGIRAELGFLYDAFDNRVWFFELIDMLHKLVITSTLAFFPTFMQIPTGLVVLMAYTICIMLVRPYKSKGDDRLHLIVQCEIFLLLYSGYLFQNDIDVDSTIDIILSIVLITMVCMLFFVFLWQVLWALRKRYKDWREKKRRNKHEFDVVEDDRFGTALHIHRSQRILPSKKKDEGIILQRNPLAEANVQKGLKGSGLTVARQESARKSLLITPGFEDFGDDDDDDETTAELMPMQSNPLFGSSGPINTDDNEDDDDVPMAANPLFQQPLAQNTDDNEAAEGEKLEFPSYDADSNGSEEEATLYKQGSSTSLNNNM